MKVYNNDKVFYLKMGGDYDMLINDVVKRTGLTKKAIRFYEDKGLLSVQRQMNSYRSYSEDNILTLKKIKMLRSCGVSVADIKLLFGNMITVEELLVKRKKEIENEYGYYSSMFTNTLNVFQNYEKEHYDLDLDLKFDETTDNSLVQSDTLILGIDIGTTSISAAVLDTENKTHIETYTLDNASGIKSSNPCFIEQNPMVICDKVIKLVELIVTSYPKIKAIGVTGQMHGIVYIDKKGDAVSPLVTWQDKRADEILENGCTYCEKIFEVTNKKIYTGFGFATHYYNLLNQLVPSDAYSFCSIMDYIVMKLTNQYLPSIHVSVAASFGLFDIKTLSFDKESISKLGMDNIALPDVTDEFFIAGNYKNIPVSVAIGDNQASFIGSVENIDDAVLVNIGTGSQISFASDFCVTDDHLELRPLFKDKYILCGSALCGGASYALLESFFRSYITTANSDNSLQYDILNKLAYDAYKQNKKPLTVNTSFTGKRSNPNIKGSILDITRENFTPGQLALGFITGICKELYDFLPANTENKKLIVASGNAVRKIPVMKHVIEDMFGLPVQISYNEEEASVGAALFSAIAANIVKNNYEASAFVSYKRR